jgi:hypothetical protein
MGEEMDTPAPEGLLTRDGFQVRTYWKRLEDDTVKIDSRAVRAPA